LPLIIFNLSLTLYIFFSCLCHLNLGWHIAFWSKLARKVHRYIVWIIFLGFSSFSSNCVVVKGKCMFCMLTMFTLKDNRSKTEMYIRSKLCLRCFFQLFQFQGNTLLCFFNMIVNFFSPNLTSILQYCSPNGWDNNSYWAQVRLKLLSLPQGAFWLSSKLIHVKKKISS